MGRVVYLGLCLLGCLLLNTSVEGASNDTVAARSPCPRGALYFRKKCYEFFSQAIPWFSAEVECQTLRQGAHLASFENSHEGRLLSAHLKSRHSGKSVWIGLSAASFGWECRWEWSSGIPYNPRFLTLNNRSPDAPLSISMCGSLSPSDSAPWKQLDCSACLPYVCKYKALY